jgi:DNA-binding CsgD family transcriptional regulator
MSSYVKHYWEMDVHLLRCLGEERFRKADCGVSQLLITKKELFGTEFHSDWLMPFDVGPMIWAKIADRHDYHASISINRRYEAEYFEEAELKVLTALAPHLRQALWLTRTLRDLQSSNAMLSQSLDEMGIAICMVRHDGAILRSTEGAERLFAAGNGVVLKNGRLKVILAKEQRVLDAMIAGACNTGANRGMNTAIKVQAKAPGNTTIGSWTPESGGAVLITRKPPLRPLQVVVSPFSPGSLMNDLHAKALIQFSDPSAVPRPRGAILRALYGLTPTEARLADLLLKGLEVHQAADRMRTTLETTRFNLKRILAKTETNRQAELMRLMLSLPGQ